MDIITKKTKIPGIRLFSFLSAAIACFFILFSLSSCEFFTSNELEKKSEKAPKETAISSDGQIGTFTLLVTPKFSDASNSITTNRSAYPDFSAELTSLDFYVSCTNVFNEVKGNYDSVSGKLSFTITSPAFENKTINFYAKNSSSKRILYSEVKNVTYSIGGSISIDPVLYFKPYTATTVTNGYIDLVITSPFGSKIVCNIYDTSATPNQVSGEEGSNKDIIVKNTSDNNCQIKTVDDGITWGQYTARIFVYKDGSETSTPDYYQETINVWPDITTKLWYLSDGSTSNEYQIAIDNSEVKIYVLGSNPKGLYEATSGLPSVATVATAQNTNAGTILAPLQTISAAIVKCTNPSINYNIICDGDFSAGFAINNGNPAQVNIKISGGGKSNYKSSITGQIIINSSASSLTFENLDISTGDSLVTAISATFSSNSTLTFNNCNIENKNGGIIFTGLSGIITNLLLNNTTISGDSTEYAVDFQAFNSKLIFKGSTFIDPSVPSKNAIRVGNTSDTILVDGPLDTSHTTVAAIKYESVPTINTQLIFVQNGADLATESQRFKYMDFPYTFTDEGKLNLEKDIYVASSTSSPAGSSSGDGSESKPFDTVTAAIALVKECANTEFCNGNYTIHISGTIKEDNKIILKKGTSETLGAFSDSTLTLCGTDKTTDILDGDYDGDGTGDHTVLAINGTDLLVTIENLTIQNGNGSFGGGINVTERATLKLGSGSVITKNANTSGYGGGGLYVERSKLFMYSDALIGYDASEIAVDAATARANGGNTTDAGTQYGGGGIFAYLGASVWIGYTAENVPDTSENVCKISGNYVANDRDGGGIYISNDSSVHICKGTISYNYADRKGGAIYCGNELEMKGTVYIPFIDVKKNDLYMSSGKQIKILDTLIPPDEANGITATITPDSYSNTTVLLKDDGSGTTLAANYDKFDVTPKGSKNWKINSEGFLYLPIKVKVNDVTYTKKADCIAAIKDSQSEQAITVTVLEADVNDLGPSGTAGTILNAIVETSAKTVDLIVAEDADIKLPATSTSFFVNCNKLYHVDLAGLDTSEVTDMQGMFTLCFGYGQTSFPEDAVLDIRNFNTANVTNMSNMFAMCVNLKTIIVGSDFKTNSITESDGMFSVCNKLVGAWGSRPDATNTGFEFAHIDGGPSNPGYFTAANYIGNKLPYEAKEVGDIVFNDGSAMSYTEFNGLSAEIKNEKKATAIALIFYKGTDLNSDVAEGTPDTTTVRTLGVGLKHKSNELAWCTGSANANEKKITTIECIPIGDAGSYTFTGDKNGSDNLSQIADFLKAASDATDDTTGEGAADRYPAFYFAMNYNKQKIGSEAASRITEGSEFEHGWYLPSIAELFQIYACIVNKPNEFDLETASQALGGDSFELQANYYKSSSQYDDDESREYILKFSDGATNHLPKAYSYYYVCCIRAF